MLLLLSILGATLAAAERQQRKNKLREELKRRLALGARPEVFNFFDIVWNVGQAHILVEDGRPIKDLPITYFDGIAGMIHVDTEHAEQAKPWEPGIAVPMPMQPGALMLIDGWHRLYKARQTDQETFPVRILSIDESEDIMIRNPFGDKAYELHREQAAGITWRQGRTRRSDLDHFLRELGYGGRHGPDGYTLDTWNEERDEEGPEVTVGAQARGGYIELGPFVVHGPVSTIEEALRDALGQLKDYAQMTKVTLVASIGSDWRPHPRFRPEKIRDLMIEEGWVRRPIRGVRWQDLRSDMKVLLDDLFYYEDVLPGQDLLSRFEDFRDGHIVLPTRTIRVEDHLHWARSQPWDERGPEHVQQMAKMFRAGQGSQLPPVVLHKGQMRDGRHRLLAAHEAKVKTLPSLHLEDFVKVVKDPLWQEWELWLPKEEEL